MAAADVGLVRSSEKQEDRVSAAAGEGGPLWPLRLHWVISSVSLSLLVGFDENKMSFSEKVGRKKHD